MTAYPDLQLCVGGTWKSADGQPTLNPADESVLGTVPLSVGEWGAALGLAAVPAIAGQLWKLYRLSSGRR